MEKARFQFDLTTALMLMIAISILSGLNLEARIASNGYWEYGWPFACCQLINRRCEWLVDGCMADAVIALIALLSIQIGRNHLFRARSAADQTNTPT